MSEKIKFVVPETNEEVEFYIIEETRISGINYLLVTEEADDSEEEAEAYILKDISKEDDSDANYIIVEDDEELDSVGKVFAELLDDIDLER